MKKRDATKDVFRAVVFAGAMLGCSSGSKAPPAESTLPPDPTGGAIATPDAVAMMPSPPDASPPDASPPDAAPPPEVVKPRPRPSGGKPSGRGFLLV